MLSEDKHGYTPLDYVVPAQQPNWRRIVDTVVGWAADSHENVTTSCSTGPADAVKNMKANATPVVSAHADPSYLIQSLSDRVVSNLRLVTAEDLTIANFMQDMDATDVRVVAQLCARSCSFLVSDCADPDAAIIAVSPAFVTETGYEPGEVLGRNCRFLQGPGTSTVQVDLIRHALATQSTVKVSLLNYKKDGGTFLNCFLLTPLHANGKVRYYIGIQNCPEAIVDDRKRNVLRQQRNSAEECNNGGWLEDTVAMIDRTRAPRGLMPTLSHLKRKLDVTEAEKPPPTKAHKWGRLERGRQCSVS